MWYIMAQEQRAYDLSERLIRTITCWQNNINGVDDDVEELIRHGADVNRAHGTLLPLQCACMAGDSSCVQLLLEHGANINALDGYGRSPLHYAAEQDADCVELLVANGADADLTDTNRDTPLHWAAFKNNHSCLRVLLQSGACPDSLDYNSDTPISWAAMKGNLECIEILLEYNARVDMENDEGKTPISRLCQLIALGLNSPSDDASLELLLRAVGQFDLRDTRGELPGAVMEDNRLSELITPYCESPRRLGELCRYSIRRELGQRYLLNIVPELPIPSQLQDFILLKS